MMWLRGSVGGAQVTSRVSNFLYDSLLRSLSEHLPIYYAHNVHIFSLSLSFSLSHTHTHTHTHTHKHTQPISANPRGWQSRSSTAWWPRLVSLNLPTCSKLAGITLFYVWYDSFICVILLVHMCDITHSYVWYYSFICVILLVHVWYYSFICVTNMLEVGRYYTFSITHIYM